MGSEVEAHGEPRVLTCDTALAGHTLPPIRHYPRLLSKMGFTPFVQVTEL